MARFRVYLEYEGTRYSGWQIQKNARTVQGELMESAQRIFRTPKLEFYGSGRTDAGVHALRQVAHLDVDTVLGPEIIRMKLNDELPADINILEIEKAPRNFHARHDAVGRSYLYQISRRRTALGKRYVWWIKDALDLRGMERAAALFIGMKDLGSFSADDAEEKSTKVLIEELTLKETGDLILVRFVGSHFLWKLVRRVVGVLVEVGRGKLAVREVEHFLKVKSDKPAKWTAPPSGLFLERVYYQGDARNDRIEPVMAIGSGHPERSEGSPPFRGPKR
ncbi:MAG TPA: tRNA pseudouridine(38-40) synthase TruA [Bacteroidota bacterium]|jgi:tRNA pseudouridine38-40 synthase